MAQLNGRSRFHWYFMMLQLLFGSKVHKKCKWLFSKHEAVFLFNLFFDNTVHFLMAVVYNDLCKGITVQKSLLFWQYGFFNPIHTNWGHKMPIWLDDGADRVSLDSFLCPWQIVWKMILEQTFWVSEWHNWMSCRCYRCTYGRSWCSKRCRCCKTSEFGAYIIGTRTWTSGVGGGRGRGVGGITPIPFERIHIWQFMNSEWCRRRYLVKRMGYRRSETKN